VDRACAPERLAKFPEAGRLLDSESEPLRKRSPALRTRTRWHRGEPCFTPAGILFLVQRSGAAFFGHHNNQIAKSPNHEIIKIGRRLWFARDLLPLQVLIKFEKALDPRGSQNLDQPVHGDVLRVHVVFGDGTQVFVIFVIKPEDSSSFTVHAMRTCVWSGGNREPYSRE
jgi:hypothetical protein